MKTSSLKHTLTALALSLCLSVATPVMADDVSDFNGTLQQANQGDVKAQYNLGVMYVQEGVRQNYTQAIYWLTKAAEQGDVYSQGILGVIYDEGVGVRQDHVQAVNWYTKAANQGNAAAQYGLGAMYAGGIGVRQDYHTAKEWFEKACDNGSQIGCDEYRKLNQMGY